MLGGRREGAGNVLAAGLGVITPFCSCSAVPAFMGFVAAGVPIGVTLSFLIASLLANEIAVGMLFALFGWKIAARYVTAGLVVAIGGGWLLGRLGVQRWVEPFVFETRLGGQPIDSTAKPGFDQRLQMGVEEVASILRKIWPYLLAGIGVGAAIHGWAPESFFTAYAGSGNVFGVLVAVIVGIPLYSNAAGVMPLVLALHEKGLPMGTLLAFMTKVLVQVAPSASPLNGSPARRSARSGRRHHRESRRLSHHRRLWRDGDTRARGRRESRRVRASADRGRHPGSAQPAPSRRSTRRSLIAETSRCTGGDRPG
jgi:uncharacterized membrane protein YraQ (UPF0718 family)